MAKVVAKAYNPQNGSTENIMEGYSFQFLFTGPYWYLKRGMTGMAFVSGLLLLGTLGISQIFFAARCNEQYADFLLRNGWMTERQWNDRLKKDNQVVAPAMSKADELEKLYNLSARGVISDAEFEKMKSGII